MLKKIFITLFIILTSSVTFSLVMPNLTLAKQGTQTFSDCREFLGMTSWDCGTNLTSGQQLTDKELEASIQKVIQNIINDILVIIGYVALGFVIYGGYLYVFSNGDPGKTATATKTLTRAFLGLAIIGAAEIILGSVGTALGISLSSEAGGSDNCFTTDCVNPDNALTSAISWVIGITGAVSAIFVVYGGIMYITSSGDPGKVQKAKKTILFSLIGLVVVALAEIITNFVIKDVVTTAVGEASDVSDVIIGILKIIISVAGIVSVVYVLIGGTQYITSSGDAAKIKKAKDTLLYACIGLIVCGIAFAIVNWVIGAIGDSTSYLEELNHHLLS